MKRRDSYSQMDRNHTATNGNYKKPPRTNIVNPEFLLGQIWIQEQETNGVKIIELDSNSSNNDDEDKQPLSHAWSYVDRDRFRIPQSPRDEYEVNYKAREKHRQKPTPQKQEVSSPEIEESCIRNFLYPNYQEPDNDVVNGNLRSQRKVNCFTKTNNYPKTSDSSTDVEYIDRNDMKTEQMSWDAEDRFYDEILTYDSKIDAEKRTIYIYSFKNKHLFTENDGLDVSNATSSSSTDIGEESVKDKSNGRVPSPIPDLYVPKLNFIKPTKLPTVTEITEPQNSKENINSKYDAKIPKNGWFSNTYKEQDKPSSYNLISSMSLSPREKRRRSRSTFCENCRNQARLQMVREVSPIGEDVQTTKNNESGLTAVGDISPPIRILGMNQEIENIQSTNDICDEENRVEDRGDHVQNKSILKPKIRLSPKSSGDITKISEPIEKLDSNNWIGDETIVVRNKISSHQLPNIEAVENISNAEDNVSKRLWENNMVLLKPTQWSAFYPVDNSVPSLHLSLETEIEEVTWFRRIMRCLKCFK